jgi:hypothetical protein
MKLATAPLQCAFVVAFLSDGGTAAATPTFFASFTPDGAACALTAQPFAPFFTYIMVYPGVSTPGITGAEFRMDGMDPAWFNIVTANQAANLSIGNPIQGGCAIAFPTCQVAPGGAVLLYTIQSLAPAPITARQFPILAHTTPSSPNFVCPLTVLCNAPVFTKECGFGLSSCVNWARTCWCEFAVQSDTWSRVKQLYATH